MQAHDDPELRAEVRRTLLYPTKPPITKAKRMHIMQMARKGYSIGFLARHAEVTELDIYRVLAEDDDAAAY